MKYHSDISKRVLTLLTLSFLFLVQTVHPVLAATDLSVIPSTAIPTYNHVVLVMLENHSYSQVVKSSNMPYLNALMKQGGLATNYYANVHPSIGNYFMLTTGKVVTRNDNYTGTTTADNIARELTAMGKTWRVYAEGLPSVGYIGGNSHRYLKRHNPFAYFSDVRNSSTQRANLVPFTQFASDLAANKLPDFTLIVPDACNDAHDCALLTADKWMKKNIAPLLADPDFKKSGLLAIAFDEGKMSDKAHGGGHDPIVLVGTNVKAGYNSTVFYQHQNLFMTFLDALGIKPFGAATSTKPMADFFEKRL